MKEEKENAQNILKDQTLYVLKSAKELYVLVSPHTKMPYVTCNPETFDDEILVYSREEDAEKEKKHLAEKNISVNLIKLENKQFLSCYTNLYTMGVNCIVLNHKAEGEVSVQLNELVKKPDSENLPKGSVWVENPELHLTALYFMQELRRQPEAMMSEELKEIQEEMLAHYQEGSYIIAAKETDGRREIPILNMKNGDSLQPVFTDVFEFRKFNVNNQFHTLVIGAEKIPEILAPEVKGVVINPFGVNVPLSVTRKKKD